MTEKISANTNQPSGGRENAFPRRHALHAAFALACMLPATGADRAMAVGLGPVIEQSALGRSLRVVIPLVTAAGEELSSECFKLVPAGAEADDVPQIVFGRVGLERTPSGARIIVTQPRPTNDPVVRLTVQAGCDTAVRREYTLFMDPPPIETPQVSEDSGTRVEAETPAPRPRSTAGETTRRPRSDAQGSGRAAAPGTAEAPRTARKAAPRKPRAAAKAAPKRPLPNAADQPRLKLSAVPPPSSPGAGATAATEAQKAREQQEIAIAIEAETLVLQRRIVELTAMVERMQQEVRANDIAQRAADAAAKAPPPPPPSPPWWQTNWPLLSLIVVLPLLIAGGLLWKRRRDVDWQPAGIAPTRPQPVPAPGVATALRNAPAGVGAPGADTGTPSAAKSARKPMPPELAAQAPPTQRPIEFELDLVAEKRTRPDKPA